MNKDILFFFEGHMDALPMYEKLESWMLSQIPNVNIKVAKHANHLFQQTGFRDGSQNENVHPAPRFISK